MSVIRIENLAKTYKGGTVALKGLDLEVEAAEVFGFVGPNGAGKSTTIKLMLDFIRPDRGAALLFDQPASGAAHRSRVGYLPESVNLHTYYTGRRLLALYANLAGVPRAGRAKRVEELLDLVGLQDAADRKVSKYSKGMVQRLGWAQAMVHDPELLILDEPTSNLDPVGRRKFYGIVRQLKDSGRTVFISSHILAEVGSVCDRVAIMHKGELRGLENVGEWGEQASQSLHDIFFKTIGQEDKP